MCWSGSYSNALQVLRESNPQKCEKYKKMIASCKSTPHLRCLNLLEHNYGYVSTHTQQYLNYGE